MWKHKTKWLVKGGRKVRCYLCGKKILEKGDLFLFHQDTGYYSHQFCQAESTTISGNERRRAVKKIAVGAAVVGAIAAGAGKFLDVSSQSKNSPAAQTILTSQGLILPALTSDPANPVAGQMWYRSDAGVTAHFDSIQNRVVYSSEINDGNVHVTSKGIINGLSVLPNDGTGWFGPDTTKGATAPGQYGGTYTETSGIQEAWTYAATQGQQTIVLSASYGPEARFQINTDILVPNITPHGTSIRLVGQGRTGGTVLQFNSGCNKGIDYGANFSNNFTGNVQIETLALWANTSTLTSLINIPSSATGGYISLRDVQYGGPVAPAYTDAAIYISGVQFVSLIGVSDEMGQGKNGVTVINAVYCWMTDYRGAGAVVTLQGNNYTFLSIKSATSIILQGNVYTYITGNYASGYTITCNNTNNIIILSGYIGLGNVTPVIISSGATVDILSLRDAILTASATDLPFVTNNGTLTYFDKRNVLFGNTDAESIVFPANSPTISTNPPVSGTAYQNTNTYDIRLKIPVTYSPTSTAAATLATGTSSTSTVTTSTKVSYPAGITTGIINTYEMVVPAGQYFELVVTNATIGTVEVQEA